MCVSISLVGLAHVVISHFTAWGCVRTSYWGSENPNWKPRVWLSQVCIKSWSSEMTGCKCYCPRFLHKGRLKGWWENVSNLLFVDSCTNFVPTYVKGILQPKVKFVVISPSYCVFVSLFCWRHRKIFGRIKEYKTFWLAFLLKKIYFFLQIFCFKLKSFFYR